MRNPSSLPDRFGLDDVQTDTSQTERVGQDRQPPKSFLSSLRLRAFM